MIVEFTGVPGVGKSFMSHEYCARLQIEGVFSYRPNEKLYSKGYLMRNLIKSFYVLFMLFCIPTWCMSLYCAIRKCNIKGLRNLTISCFNGIFLKYLLSKSNKDRVLVLDEGILQYLFALNNKSCCELDTNAVKSIMNMYPLPNIIYYIEASENTIKNRINCDYRNWRRRKNFGKKSVTSMKTYIDFLIDYILNNESVEVYRLINE